MWRWKEVGVLFVISSRISGARLNVSIQQFCTLRTTTHSIVHDDDHRRNRVPQIFRIARTIQLNMKPAFCCSKFNLHCMRCCAEAMMLRKQVIVFSSARTGGNNDPRIGSRALQVRIDKKSSTLRSMMHKKAKYVWRSQMETKGNDRVNLMTRTY